ncbi:MAG: indolepyruvate ferredoxin oxidoreductase subunit alpha [Promethearchaeia archaeon]
MKISELFEDNPKKKGLMSGNEAFARGIVEAGVGFAASYPGTPLSEVGDYLNDFSRREDSGITYDNAINEKVALEECIGSAWSGIRAVAFYKHLGINVSADPLHTFPYSGVNAGLVILCGGDPGILSSTNAQDNRLYSLHTKIPIIEPATVQECKDYIKQGLRISELYEIPIYVHVTTRLCHSYGVVEYGEIQTSQDHQKKGYFKRDPSRYINTLKKAQNNQKNYFKKISKFAQDKKVFHLMNKVVNFQEKEASSQNSKEYKTAILTSGICYSYVIQACHKLNISPPIMKLGLIFPVNRQEICKFADENNLDKLLVVEELEPLIETFSKETFCNFCDARREEEIHGKDFLPNVGELSTDIIMKFFAKHYDIKNKYHLKRIAQKDKALQEFLPKLPMREPTFCPGCQYRPVFYALKNATSEFKEETGIEYIYGGDIGCYTLSESYPFQLIDWVVCMGAGVGISNGLAQTIDLNKQKIIAFIGDSTFYHTGMQPLLNAIKKNLDILVVIFNNYWTAMTGHQTHFGTPKRFREKEKHKQRQFDLSGLIKSMGVDQLTVTGAYNVEKLEKIFYRNVQKTGIKVIIINEECALEKKSRLRKEEKSTDKENKKIYYKILDTCVKCNECIEYLGCPAINAKYMTKENKEGELEYYIDQTRCVPDLCRGVCKSVCKNNAILKTIIYRKNELKK